MVETSYIFKPKTRQADAVADAVRELRKKGFDRPEYNLTLSRFFEFSVDRTLTDYKEAPDRFVRELEKYLFEPPF